MILHSPYAPEWNFGRIPDVDDVPPDARLIVWAPDLPYVGAVYPWGNDEHPVRWVGSLPGKVINCIDGLWSVQRDGKTSWEDLNVWWVWEEKGTEGRIHDYPTWRQKNGRLRVV